jgi:2-keto-3-deoxy-galactonokinase
MPAMSTGATAMPIVIAGPILSRPGWNRRPKSHIAAGTTDLGA